MDIPDKISIEDLKKYKFIFRERGSGTRNVVEHALKDKGIEIKPDIEASSSKAIAKFVANSDYLAFISRLVVENDIKLNNLKIVEVDNLKIKRKFSYITQKNIRLPTIEREFINEMFKYFK